LSFSDNPQCILMLYNHAGFDGITINFHKI
jgi:hypothetical protein